MDKELEEEIKRLIRAETKKAIKKHLEETRHGLSPSQSRAINMHIPLK
jgi:hypothetical protein